MYQKLENKSQSCPDLDNYLDVCGVGPALSVAQLKAPLFSLFFRSSTLFRIQILSGANNLLLTGTLFIRCDPDYEKRTWLASIRLFDQ